MSTGKNRQKYTEEFKRDAARRSRPEKSEQEVRFYGITC